jgi:hypothetical protein
MITAGEDNRRFSPFPLPPSPLFHFFKKFQRIPNPRRITPQAPVVLPIFWWTSPLNNGFFGGLNVGQVSNLSRESGQTTGWKPVLQSILPSLVGKAYPSQHLFTKEC